MFPVRCFGRPGAQGSTITAFNTLASQRCVLHRQWFSSSVCQTIAELTGASTTKAYKQCWKEWAVWCAQEGVPNNVISPPILTNSLPHLFWVVLSQHTVYIYQPAISAFLEHQFCQ